MEEQDRIAKLADRSARPVSRRWRVLLALVLFVVIGGLLRNALGIDEWSAEGVRALVGRAGVWGPLIFIALLVVRLVLVIPSVILLSAGGLLFGTFAGAVYGTIGLTLSGLFSYGLVHWMGPDAFRARIAPRFHAVLEIARSSYGAAAIFVISAYPFGPITVAHLGAAVAGMGLVVFVLAVGLGSLVRASTFSLFGAALLESDRLGWALALLAAAFLVPLAIPRSREWLRRSFGLGSGEAPPGAPPTSRRPEDPGTDRDT